jgi:hypothetical protein
VRGRGCGCEEGRSLYVLTRPQASVPAAAPDAASAIYIERRPDPNALGCYQDEPRLQRLLISLPGFSTIAGAAALEGRRAAASDAVARRWLRLFQAREKEVESATHPPLWPANPNPRRVALLHPSSPAVCRLVHTPAADGCTSTSDASLTAQSSPRLACRVAHAA